MPTVVQLPAGKALTVRAAADTFFGTNRLLLGVPVRMYWLVGYRVRIAAERIAVYQYSKRR